MITDKTVNPQNQHASTAFYGGKWTAGEQSPCYQTHGWSQLGTLHVNAIRALTGNNFQRPFATGNNQRRHRNDGARFRCRQIGTHAGFPDDEFAGSHKAKRTRPRIANRTNQIMQRLRGFFPLQTPVFRGATAHIGGLRIILRTFLGLAAADFRQRIAQQHLGGRTQLTVQRQRDIGISNCNRLLSHDIPGVSAGNHAVQRHTRFTLTVDQYPIQRRPPTILRQQRTVQVECAFWRKL